MRFVALSCVLAFTLGVGCTVNNSSPIIDPAKVAQIQKGVTTRSQVEAMLGPPMSVGMMPNGARSATYYSFNATASATPISYVPIVGDLAAGAKGTQRQQQLQIMYNAAGVVDDYEFSDNTGKIDRGYYYNNSQPMQPTQPKK